MATKSPLTVIKPPVPRQVPRIAEKYKLNRIRGPKLTCDLEKITFKDSLIYWTKTAIEEFVIWLQSLVFLWKILLYGGVLLGGIFIGFFYLQDAAQEAIENTIYYCFEELEAE